MLVALICLTEELDVRRSNPSLNEASKMSLEQLDHLLSLHMLGNEMRMDDAVEDPLGSVVGHKGNSVNKHPSFQEFPDPSLLSEWCHPSNLLSSKELRHPVNSLEQSSKYPAEVVRLSLPKEGEIVIDKYGAKTVLILWIS